MRPNLPIVTLCALLLAASACTPENADTTDDCPDASCDEQPGEDADLLADAGPDASDADAGPNEDPLPRPERDVLIEVIWERLENESQHADSITDLDLHYCHAFEGSLADNMNSCTSYNNTSSTFYPTPDSEPIEVAMLTDSLVIDSPEWVVHDHSTAGHTHLVVHGYSVRFAVRAHARVYLDGELAWENSVELTPEVSKAIWYAGTIDWHEDPAQVTITDGPSCAERDGDDPCHDENDSLYLRDVTFAEAP